MQLDLHVWFHNVPDLGLLGALSKLSQQVEQIMSDLTALTAEVANNTEVDQSAIALLNGLSAQIEALKTDPAALQGLADTLKSSSAALAAAVVANTPAAP